MKYLWLLVLIVFTNCIYANSAPEISNIYAVQRTDDSGIVDISYTLTDADGDSCIVSMLISDDGGSTWNVSATDISGDLGSAISPGRHTITWNTKTDLPGQYGNTYKIQITADDSNTNANSSELGMKWVYVNDSGVSGHEGFMGYMSKYETTNAQYCQYLNAALVSGDIYVSDGYVYGNSGSYSGKTYFRTYESYSYSQISYNGTFSVRTRDGYSMANHPVVFVTWYGATSFASYYGWRLPTEWEWQAVADYDGNYTYGTGNTINTSIANYNRSNPIGFNDNPYTTPVGYYGPFGYGLCDMAGNVFELTSNKSVYSSYYHSIRGGCWANYSAIIDCRVSFYANVTEEECEDQYTGFRVCR